MNDEELTSVLLSGAARDLEQVAEVREDDLNADEHRAIADLVARVKGLHERLAYSSSLRETATRADAMDRLRRIMEDSRYHYEPADVEVNGPLALIQSEQRGKAQVYAWITGTDIPGQGDLDPGEWDGFGDDEEEVSDS
jgi:hypothetical protein